MALALRPGLTFCRLEENFIFLDRDADRYFSVSGALARCLQALLNRDAAEPSIHEVDVLKKMKLIVDGDGAPLMACDHRPAHISMLGARGGGGFTPIALIGVLFRLAKMRRRLRKGGLPQMLREIDARRISGSNVADVENLRELALLYDLSRLFFLPTDHCLVRALTFYIHAADIGCRVRLVIGVQQHPFSAHCWIEHGHLILDDGAEHVSRFSPILVL